MRFNSHSSVKVGGEQEEYDRIYALQCDLKKNFVVPIGHFSPWQIRAVLPEESQLRESRAANLD